VCVCVCVVFVCFVCLCVFVCLFTSRLVERTHLLMRCVSVCDTALPPSPSVICYFGHCACALPPLHLTLSFCRLHLCSLVLFSPLPAALLWAAALLGLLLPPLPAPTPLAWPPSPPRSPAPRLCSPPLAPPLVWARSPTTSLRPPLSPISCLRTAPFRRRSLARCSGMMFPLPLASMASPPLGTVPLSLLSCLISLLLVGHSLTESQQSHSCHGGSFWHCSRCRLLH
jgi:hypothetical protein